MRSDRLLVTGGGTGGHIYPGLAIIEGLKPAEVLYVGSRQGLEKKLIQNHGLPFQSVFSRPLMGQSVSGKILGGLALGAGFLQSIGVERRFKPNVIVGTGGYVGLPVLLAGSFLRIPTLLLEQNLLPGRTTRFLSRFVSRVLISFPESQTYLPRANTVVTGTPVRPEIGTLTKEESCRRLGITSADPVITVMGASQGARALNRVLLEALPALADKSWQIVHLTGEKHYASVVEESRMRLKIGDSPPKLRYRAFAYVEDMAAVYGASDFLVARGGATSLAEIMQAGKPSLLVPYPYAADNHQELNARWLERKKACRVILEKDLTSSVLVRTLEEMMSRSEILRSFGMNARRASTKDSLGAILRVIREVAR